MRWFLVVAVSLFLFAGECRADGIVLPRVVDQASVSIPDQQALISYVDGVETLAIETRFEGTGSEFAWVVPVPAVPEVSAATLGTFPSLRAMFAPKVHSPTATWALILVCGPILLITLDLLFWRKPATLAGWVLLILGCVVIVGLCLPALGKPRGVSDSAVPGVKVHERKVVGAYDTAVISSDDAAALGTWLSSNGFAVARELEPVIAQYVKEGWCFVANRLRRDSQGAVVMTPHPIVLKFPAKAPVYPMRLTALGMKDGLGLDLYFFGAGTPSFDVMEVVASCRLADRETGEDTELRVSHATVRSLTLGAKYGSKLTGVFKREQMTRDIVLDVREARTHRPSVVSHTDGVLAGLGAAFAGALLASVFVAITRRGKVVPPSDRLRALRFIGGIGITAGAGVFFWMPRVDTIAGRDALSKSSAYFEIGKLLWGHGNDGTTDPKSLDEARERIRAEFGRTASSWLIEGDGPGSYRLEEQYGGIYLKYVDLQGQESEHLMVVLPETTTTPS